MEFPSNFFASGGYAGEFETHRSGEITLQRWISRKAGGNIVMTRETIIVRAVKFLLLASLFLAFSPRGWAQLTTTATLNGTVTDSSGGSVPQAAITVASEDTNVETH